MRKKERIIVKYNPEFYNENGVYIKDEWTSFNDIGKIFNNRILTIREYINIENNYIDFILECLKLAGCDFLTIDWSWDYEKKNLRSSMKRISELDPNFDEYGYLELLHEIESRKRISISTARLLFKLMLRESFNLSLSNKKNKIKLFVSYEYYLHLFTCIDTKTLKEIADKYRLYVVW